MKQDFDELIRDTMTNFTDGIDLPPRLVADARRQHHRRRVRVGWLASEGAVAGAAAVTIAMVATGTGSGHVGHHEQGLKSGQIETTAMVISQVERALTTAVSGHPVAYTRQVSHGIKLFLVAPHGKPVQVHGSVISTWSRGPLQRVVIGAPGGKPALSTVTDNSGGK
jgi:hypothetical protein